MNRIILTVMVLSMCSCMSAKRYQNYVNWDSNRDSQLSNYEFISGFRRSKYFLRWTNGHYLREHVFYDSIYHKMDLSGDRVLTDKEFEQKINYYYLDRRGEIFDNWDDDSSDTIDKDEFMHHAAASALFTKWDRTGDGLISEREMANGMFYLCDLDGDGLVSSIEFNIWKVNR